MAESRISYLNRTYDEYKASILDITQKYYGDIFANYNDAGIGDWLMDIPADIADNLSYNIDRAYQETDIDSATSRESLLTIARTNGLKISGPKCAIVEIEVSCIIPMNNSQVDASGNNISQPDESYAPYIKMGTKFSDGVTNFELMYDLDFTQQFDKNGISNRQIITNRDNNGIIKNYTYKKLGIACAGNSKIFKRRITNADIKPFFTITLSDVDITNVESIICKKKDNGDPTLHEFYVDKESYEDMGGMPVERYFEVDNLCEQYRFGYVIDENASGNNVYDPIWSVVDEFVMTNEDGSAVVDENGDPISEPIRLAAKGEWKRLKNKYVTEFQDNGDLAITFGTGLKNINGNIPGDATEFTKYLMSRMEANDYMGVLPQTGSYIYILYRVGGGEISNVGANTVNVITYLNMDIEGNCNDSNNDKKKVSVKNSLKVTNPTPSYGGKDAPSDEEVKYLIKYNSAEQARCITLKDYYSRISKIHPRYGCPFRHSVVEENNKVVIYALGLDYQGHLLAQLSETVGDNIKEYLKEYKCVNDFVEIRPGKVINLAFDVNIYVDKAYDKSDVIKRVIELIKDYMDIRKHIMGEDIFLGDLEKEISKLDGVQNLIALRCYNKVGDGYSEDNIDQSTVSTDSCYELERAEKLGDDEINENEIDLAESDKVLYSAIDTMFEIKYPNRDISVRVKQR